MDTLQTAIKFMKTWLLHDLNRPQGCVLVHPFRTRTSEVFEIYLERSVICFQ